MATARYPGLAGPRTLHQLPLPAGSLDHDLLAVAVADPAMLADLKDYVNARGRCTDLSPAHYDDFFPPTVPPTEPARRDEAARTAARLCAGCPVMNECLTWAVVSGQDYGTWGGRPEHEVKAMGVAHRRARRVLARTA